jgi:hypothetical protein
MKVQALLGKGLGDEEDSWDIVSLHTTVAGAEKARTTHAAAVWDEGNGLTLEEYIDENYEINEHELQT